MITNSISVEGLCKSYKDFSLKNVNFSVPMGSIMGFIGENGAGKTTTIKGILNLTRRNEGKIEIFGMDNIKYEKQIKQDIGVVLDESCFPENLMIDDLPLILKNVFESWDNELFFQYTAKFKLPKKKIFKEFSRGMKMKLAIAAALAHHPKLLILDEATGGLDPVVRNEILDVFLDFIQDEQHSILISSHIISDIEKIADYVTFIHQGEIVFSESKDKLIYEYGMLKCTAAEAANVDKHYIISAKQTAFSFEAIVKNKEEFMQKYKNLLVDSISIEEIMMMLINAEGSSNNEGINY